MPFRNVIRYRGGRLLVVLGLQDFKVVLIHEYVLIISARTKTESSRNITLTGKVFAHEFSCDLDFTFLKYRGQDITV